MCLYSHNTSAAAAAAAAALFADIEDIEAHMPGFIEVSRIIIILLQ